MLQKNSGESAPTMLLLDALIRISAITMLVALAVISARDLKPSRSWLYLFLASLSTAALFFSLSNSELSLSPKLSFLMGFVNVPHLVFIWLFALSVFQTEFKLSKWHVITGFLYCFPIFWFRAFQFEFLPQPPFILTIGVAIGSILLMVHLVWTIVQERKNDLLNARKRARLVFVIILVSITALTAIIDLYLIAIWPDWAVLIKAAAIWPAVTAGFFWILKASKDSFISDTIPATFSNVKNEISAKDAALFQGLQTRIKVDHIYLNPKLTINDLATDLGVTRHRLRALINRCLGYENFNQFLNTHRIEAIVKTLDDRNHDHIPILTIALDGGFQSLAPFNRAFKKIMGQTPSQYRKQKNGSNASH
jgi:AraC-like DNA-binding protein